MNSNFDNSALGLSINLVGPIRTLEIIQSNALKFPQSHVAVDSIIEIAGHFNGHNSEFYRGMAVGLIQGYVINLPDNDLRLLREFNTIATLLNNRGIHVITGESL